MTAFGMCLPGMLTIDEKNGTKFVTADDSISAISPDSYLCVRVIGSLQNTTEPAGTTLSSILAFVNGHLFASSEGAVSGLHSADFLVSLCSLTCTGTVDLFHHRYQ